MRVMLVMAATGSLGGAERYVANLAAGLVGGLEVDVVVFEPHQTTGLDRLVTETAAAGVTVWRHQELERATLEALVRRRSPDVLHWNFPSPFAFDAASWLRHAWGRPQVVTDHLPGVRAGRRWNLSRGLTNRVIDHVIVVAPSAVRPARQGWLFSPKVTVVPNGVPLRGQRLRPDCREGGRVVFVARLEDQKNPRLALEAVAACRRAGRDVTLDVVGQGSLEAALRRRSAAPDLKGAVRFLGFRDDPHDVVLAADCFMSTSSFEGYPLSPLEAIVAGTPCLLSDIDAHRDMAMAAGGVRLLHSEDPEEWGRALDGALREAERLSSAALSCREDLSSERMVERTAAVYRMLLS